jgi:hypothetical protein
MVWVLFFKGEFVIVLKNHTSMMIKDTEEVKKRAEVFSRATLRIIKPGWVMSKP